MAPNEGFSFSELFSSLPFFPGNSLDLIFYFLTSPSYPTSPSSGFKFYWKDVTPTSPSRLPPNLNVFKGLWDSTLTNPVRLPPPPLPLAKSPGQSLGASWGGGVVR